MKNKFKLTSLQTVLAIALLFAAEFFSDAVAGGGHHKLILNMRA